MNKNDRVLVDGYLTVCCTLLVILARTGPKPGWEPTFWALWASLVVATPATWLYLRHKCQGR